MGMTIDEIEQWEKENKTVKVPEEKWLLAQETMRKYQKIQEIHKEYADTQYEYIGIQKIGEVLGDGNGY